MARSGAELPTGAVTYLFSDIEGSTSLLQRLGPGYRDVLERHAQIVRRGLDATGGVEVSTEGDSFFAVFQDASRAVDGARQIQHDLAEENWPDGGAVSVRMGLHSGIAELGHDDYIGLDVHLAARIAGSAHGGQVVASSSVAALWADDTFTYLGEFELSGLEDPQPLYQLRIPGLPEAFPPLRTRAANPNNLPTQASALIGREPEVAEILEMVRANRLTTLIGPGGIGKTRLAVEVAARATQDFDGGVLFVDLAPIDDPGLVLPAISAELGTDKGSAEAIARELGDRARLLLLDNFEQVVECAPAIGELMNEAPTLKFLATSQVPLKLRDESVFRLRPLPVEENGSESPAVALFEERARRADPGFDPIASREAVRRLVVALDGVPLAVELAAARTNVLDVEDILDRLTGGVDVLASRTADAPQRHHSISAAIEWSFGLLSEPQRELLTGFGVFRAGATLKALDTIFGRDVSEDLAELVDHSLVDTRRGQAGKRFTALAPIQLFARERMEDAGELSSKHASFFFELAKEARAPLEGDERGRWLAILGDEHENLQGMLDHFLAGDGAQQGLEALGSVWRYFQAVGRFNELELWLERFFAQPEARDPTRARARGLMARAAIAYWRSDSRGAVADYREAVTIADQSDDAQLKGEAWYGLAASLGSAGLAGETGLGEPEEALDALERARSIFTELDDASGLASVEAGDAFIRAWAGGSPTPTRERLHQVMAAYEAAGQRINAAHTLIGLAGAALFDGEYEEALSASLESLGRADEIGDRFVAVWAVEWVAAAQIGLGNSELGARLAGAAEAARERMGGGWTPATYGLDSASDLAVEELGDRAASLLAEGRTLSLDEAIDLSRRTG